MSNLTAEASQRNQNANQNAEQFIRLCPPVIITGRTVNPRRLVAEPGET